MRLSLSWPQSPLLYNGGGWLQSLPNCESGRNLVSPPGLPPHIPCSELHFTLSAKWATRLPSLLHREDGGGQFEDQPNSTGNLDLAPSSQTPWSIEGEDGGGRSSQNTKFCTRGQFERKNLPVLYKKTKQPTVFLRTEVSLRSRPRSGVARRS